MSRELSMYLYLLVFGALEVASQKRMDMITGKNSAIGGRINGKPSNSQAKELYLTTTSILKNQNLKNGAKCKLKILKKRSILAKVFLTIQCLQ